jgi:hypothetical protein
MKVEGWREADTMDHSITGLFSPFPSFSGFFHLFFLRDRRDLGPKAPRLPASRFARLRSVLK